jgi:hypothetical protein
MKKIVSILLLLSVISFSQEKLTATINQDIHLVFGETYMQTENNLKAQKRSVAKAALLSAILPGAGQFYNEDYWKTAIFVAVEITAITVAYVYDKKGDDQTDFYHNFADEHWSVARYAEWTYAHLNELNPNLDPTNYSGLFNNDGSVNWDVLNRMEEDIGGYYSHQLYPYGDQQYYEMIGKYTQFNVGWDDFCTRPVVECDYHYGDPVTPHFKYYSEQRGLANDYYNIARWGVITIVTNHIISAAEAAFSANKYNRSLHVRMEVGKTNIGYVTEYFPKLNVSYRF